MNTALIYRPNNRKLIGIAFVCAITIHLSAIAIAITKTRPVSLTSWDEADDQVIGIDAQTLQVEDVSPPEDVLSPPNEEAFPQENSTPATSHARKKTPISAIRSTKIGTGKAARPGSVKSLTLYAPKPNYPYEARRGGTTGSGVVQLTVNFDAGNVIDARMTQSTGSTILDTATIEALRRWRFKPGAVETVSVPITFTLSGVSY